MFISLFQVLRFVVISIAVVVIATAVIIAGTTVNVIVILFGSLGLWCQSKLIAVIVAWAWCGIHTDVRIAAVIVSSNLRRWRA